MSAPLACVSLASCAAGEEIEETVGSVTEQVDDGLQAVPVANALSCDTERRTIEMALQAYEAVVGSAPSSEADLVTQGILREESALYDLDPTGAIVPATGSSCG